MSRMLALKTGRRLRRTWAQMVLGEFCSAHFDERVARR